MQRWRGQAREYRQKQLLNLEKDKNTSRLYVPHIARGVSAEDKGNEDPLVYLLCQIPPPAIAQSHCCHDVTTVYSAGTTFTGSMDASAAALPS